MNRPLLSLLALFLPLILAAAPKGTSIPAPAHSGMFEDDGARDEIADEIAAWSEDEQENPWEMSGLYEGDIMTDGSSRNVIRDKTNYWEGATVPYYIEKSHFTERELQIIHEGLKEYHQKTCIKFKPYKKGEKDFIVVRGNRTGCWSYVGRQGGGQVLNLQTPGCVYRGIVIHEFLHALGFFHQQSAADRDQYIKINYENIKEGKEHNFEKYNDTFVNDFNVGYDYGSIMHYSAYAFSKNRKPTMEALDKKTKFGQRKGLSKKDIEKLSKIYKCGERTGWALFPK